MYTSSTIRPLSPDFCYFLHLPSYHLPACPARGKKSDDPTCTGHRFFFFIGSTEGAEPTEQFHARCADSLLKLFEYMIRMDVTEAACVTHGGVIMSMLSQRAVPTRRPEQWMADPGCGYTVQTDVQLWMRDKLVEAIDIVPFGYADTLQGQAEAEENEAYE